MNLKIKINSAMEILAALALWSAFLKNAISFELHDIMAVISVVIGIILLANIICSLKISKTVYKIWFLFAGFGLLNHFLIGRMYYSIFSSMMLSYFPIAVYVVFAEKVSSDFWKANYIAANLYLIYRMIVSPDGYLLFYSVSRNNLSVLLLGWLIVYFVVLVKNNENIPFWPIMCYFISCLLAIGRFGIFCGTLIFTLFVIYYFYIKEGHRGYVHQKGIIVLLIILALSVSFLLNGDQIAKLLFSRFFDVGTGGKETRFGLWEYYILKCKNLKYILLGVDMSMDAVFTRFGGNLHNSYLHMHSFFGMGGLIILIFGAFKSIVALIKQRQYELTILSLGFFVRIMTDGVLPGSFGGDISFWIILFFAMRADEKNRKGNAHLANEVYM